MSKQKLTIEHLAPYLPYKLKMKFEGEDFEHELVGLDITEYGLKLISVYEDYGTATLDSAKPILRPLSDLTKEDYKEELLTYYEGLGISIKHMSYYDSGNNDLSDFTILVTYKMLDDVFTDCLINRSSISESPYHFVNWLHENHFDTDGLIDKGLAINLNEVK